MIPLKVVMAVKLKNAGDNLIPIEKSFSIEKLFSMSITPSENPLIYWPLQVISFSIIFLVAHYIQRY